MIVDITITHLATYVARICPLKLRQYKFNKCPTKVDVGRTFDIAVQFYFQFCYIITICRHNNVHVIGVASYIGGTSIK